MTLGIYTLGCKLNFSESSTFGKELSEAGFSIVPFNEKADFYLIHSCAVTQTAEKKTRAAIYKAHRKNETAKIVVIGCYAQLKPNEINDISGVIMVMGNEEKFNIVTRLKEIAANSDLNQNNDCNSFTSISFNDNNFIKNNSDEFKFHGAWSGSDRTRSFLKIQDGCDYFCSYCTVPYARGTSRSGTINDTVSMALKTATEGFKEIVLTGVNLGDFGRKNGESFYDLLSELEKIEKIERIRISSIEPNLLTDEIIKLVSMSNKILPHFHIPLQSGSDTMLNLMKRRYDTALYANKIYLIKDLMPNACIASDVIVGFNGENENEFENTFNFINLLPISYLHVFTYSERPRTKGLDIEGKVPNYIRDARSKILHKLSNEKLIRFYESQRGKESKVLWEDTKNRGMMSGWTENYIEVRRKYDSDIINTIEKVTLSNLQNGFYLI